MIHFNSVLSIFPGARQPLITFLFPVVSSFSDCYIKKILQYVAFLKSNLFLLSIMFEVHLCCYLYPPFVHFFVVVEKQSIVWIQDNVFIYSPVERRLGYFKFGVIMNKDIIIILVCGSVWTCSFIFLLDKYLCEISGVYNVIWHP